MALERSAHLGVPPRPIAALAALAIGVISLVGVLIAQHDLAQTPALALTLPGFVLAAIASVVSLVRKEPRGYLVWAPGLGLAAATIVLGWFLMIGIVVVATVIIILILHAVM